MNIFSFFNNLFHAEKKTGNPLLDVFAYPRPNKTVTISPDRINTLLNPSKGESQQVKSFELTQLKSDMADGIRNVIKQNPLNTENAFKVVRNNIEECLENSKKIRTYTTLEYHSSFTSFDPSGHSEVTPAGTINRPHQSFGPGRFEKNLKDVLKKLDKLEHDFYQNRKPTLKNKF